MALISETKSMIGITLQRDWDSAMYSASVVERAIMPWSLEAQTIGHPAYKITQQEQYFTVEGSDDMGSKRATDQVNNDSQTLGKYPIRFRFMIRIRFRVQLTMEQPHELRIIIN